MESETKKLGYVDYTVLAGTLLVSLLIGVYYACVKTQKTNADLLVGGRKMAIIPSALSLLATYMSAILVLGYTGEIYANGTLISEIILGCFFFIPLGGALFLPTLYGLRLTSVYEYLEMRFESVTVRLLATATFIIQVIMYMGVVLFAPALALKAMVDFPIEWAMVGVGLCAASYTAIGGLKAVVWTDVFQILMMLAGMLAIIIRGSSQLGGFAQVFQIAQDHGRINFFNFELDPFVRHTSFSLFFGQGVGWMSAFGCHQMTVQRYCSMSSLRRAFIALLLTTPLVALTMSFAALSGVVIFANYAGCDPLSLGKITRSDQIAPHFVQEFLSPVPGLVGLFIACLFSGSLSTLSSGINSLAAVLVEDFLKRIHGFEKLSDSTQGLITKLSGLFFGILAVGMGFVVKNLGGVLQATIVVNGSVTGPLLGIFILGILIPFSNKYGAIVGMLLGHTLTLWISVGSLVNIRKPMRTLQFSTDDCEDDIWTSFNQTIANEKQRSWIQPDPVYEWPEKIYTISYLLYPLIGSTITVVVGCFVSLCTGPQQLTKHQEPYIHPLIVKLKKTLHKVPENPGNHHMQNLHAIDGKSLMISSDYKRANGFDNRAFHT